MSKVDPPLRRAADKARMNKALDGVMKAQRGKTDTPMAPPTMSPDMVPDMTPAPKPPMKLQFKRKFTIPKPGVMV